MSHARKAVMAAIAALALGGTMVAASSAPAEAHNYYWSGTVSAKEARKLFKETFKQRCLTEHEVTHIVHGDGWWEDADEDGDFAMNFPGTTKSHIGQLSVWFAGNCVDKISAVKQEA